jgi:hypothetical protein
MKIKVPVKKDGTVLTKHFAYTMGNIRFARKWTK